MDIQVKITLPDDLANIDSEKVSRSVLEQVIAEGYKEGRLNLKQVRVLLGFKSRIEAEGFLHRQRAAEYTISDLKSDLENLKDLGLR
jgi:hypothetical protein